MSGDAPQRPPDVTRAAASGTGLVAAVRMVRATGLVSAGIFVWFGIIGYPPVAGDGAAFLPPIIEGARGRSPINRVWIPARQFDPQGIGRHVYHGPLHQMALTAAMRAAGATDFGVLLLLINLLHAGVVLLSAELVVLALRGAEADAAADATADGGGTAAMLPMQRMSVGGGWWSAAATGVLAVLLTAAVVHTTVSRPEGLTCLIVAAGAVAVVRCDRAGRPSAAAVIGGIAVGLAGAAGPAGAVMSAPVLAVWRIGWDRTFPAWLMRMTVAGAAAIGTLGAVSHLVPFPLADHLEGIRRNAAVNTGGFEAGALLPALVTNGTLPLFVLVLPLMIGALLRPAWSTTDPRMRCVAVAIALGTVAVGVYLGMLVSWRLYNVASLVALTGAVLAAGAWRDRLAGSRAGGGRVAPWLPVLLMLPAAAGFVRSATLAGCQLQDGMSLAAAQDRWRELVPPPCNRRRPLVGVAVLARHAAGGFRSA